MQVPDYVEPLPGWRVWEVIELDGRLRLCSLAFWTAWQPRRAMVALCRRSAANLAWSGEPEHLAPLDRCSCGIYATRTSGHAVSYLSRLFRSRTESVHRIVGRVSLWGTIVEGERGWRASHAYPAAFYVPTARKRFRAILSGLRRPTIPPDEIAFQLTDYGVPVELVDVATVGELADYLAASESEDPPPDDALGRAVRSGRLHP